MSRPIHVEDVFSQPGNGGVSTVLRGSEGFLTEIDGVDGERDQENGMIGKGELLNRLKSKVNEPGIGKAPRPTVSFSPHPRHHPYRADARVSTSLRPTLGQRTPSSSSVTKSNVNANAAKNNNNSAANQTPLRPTNNHNDDSNITPTTNNTNNQQQQIQTKSILKRKREHPIRMAASVEEGTRGNTEESRMSGRFGAHLRPGLVPRDSLKLISVQGKAIVRPSGEAQQDEGTVDGAGAREDEVPGSDDTVLSANIAEGSCEEDGAGEDAPENGEGDPNNNNNPFDVEMVEIISEPSTIDSLLDIIINESDDLLAVEDAYNLLFNRLKKSFMIGQDNGRTNRSIEEQNEVTAILRAFRDNASDVFRALLRDIKRLVQPAPVDTRFLGSSSPIAEPTSRLNTPSPTPDHREAGKKSPKGDETPKPTRQGFSEAEVRERRAAAGVGQAALKVLSFVGYHLELHLAFSEADITTLLHAVLTIPATPKLNTPNSKKTYTLAVYVISLMRVPLASVVPVRDKIVRAICNAVGEVGAKFWTGTSPSRQEGVAGNSIKAKIEGYSAIWNVCSRYPSLFVSAHKEFVPEILKGITFNSPQVRMRASAAAGGLAKGKLQWIREAEFALKETVVKGQAEGESDGEWELRREEVERQWKRARHFAAESETTMLQQLRKSAKAPYGQELSRRLVMWDTVESMLKTTMINDPQWACATWSCLVTLLGEGYINENARYKSFQHIILTPLSKPDGSARSPGRTWLSRFAYDHTIFSIINYKKSCFLSEHTPRATYDLDYSLGEKMLNAVMSLVTEAWSREKELQASGKDAAIVEVEGKQVWKRQDPEASQTYLKSCGSGVVGIAYAFSGAIQTSRDNLTAVIGDETQLAVATEAAAKERISSRLDKMWNVLKPVIENMLDVKAVDWMKVEGWKLLSALLKSEGAEAKLNDWAIDRLLHNGYLEGESANTEVPIANRESILFDLAQQIAETRLLPEDVPGLPVDWIVQQIPDNLGKLFQRAVMGIHTLTDRDLVDRLWDLATTSVDAVALPADLMGIWRNMLMAIKACDPKSPLYGRALVVITQVMVELECSSETTVVPPSANPICALEVLRWGITRQLFAVANEILGPEAVSAHILPLATLTSSRNAASIANTAVGADEHGNPTVVGALIHRLLILCPDNLEERPDMQHAFSSQLRLLTSVLAGGSASKRVIGDLTNRLSTFHTNIPIFRSELWHILASRWVALLKRSKSSSSNSNNTCHMLVELLLKPFREGWSEILAHDPTYLAAWEALLHVTVQRSQSKAVNPAEAVIEPLLLALFDITKINAQHNFALTTFPVLTIVLKSCTTADHPSPGVLGGYQPFLSSILPSISLEDFRIYGEPLLREFVVAIETRLKCGKVPEAEAFGPFVLAGCALQPDQSDFASMIEDLRFRLLSTISQAIEDGALLLSIERIRFWCPGFASLLTSVNKEHSAMCTRFWHICFDKFGENCFPVDQAEDIRESLGHNSIPQPGFESQSIVQPGSPQDELAAEAMISEPDEIYDQMPASMTGYDADVSAVAQTPTQAAEKRKAREDAPLQQPLNTIGESASNGDETRSSPSGSKRSSKRLARSVSDAASFGPNISASKRRKTAVSASKSETHLGEAIDSFTDAGSFHATSPAQSKSTRRKRKAQQGSLQKATPRRPSTSIDLPGAAVEQSPRMQLEVVIPVPPGSSQCTSPTPPPPAVLDRRSSSNPSAIDDTASPAATLTPAQNRFIATERKVKGKIHIAIISTGSLASVNVPNIVESLCEDSRFEIQIVATRTSLAFFSPEVVSMISDNRVQVWTDEHEWASLETSRHSPLHVEIRKWADMVLIAPCDANMLGRMTKGLYDDLATSLVRCLSRRIPTFVFPSMNAFMLENPLTTRQFDMVRDVLGFKIFGPQSAKKNASFDTTGSMTDWREIVGIVKGHAETMFPSARGSRRLEA